MTIHALKVTESDLERAEERGEMGETKIMELEEELKVKMMMMCFLGFISSPVLFLADLK